MDKGTLWGIAAAPIVGPAFWWLVMRPGKWAHTFLWKRLPEGRLRSLLLRKVS